MPMGPINATNDVCVQVERLAKTYVSKTSTTRVLDNLDLDVRQGEMLVLLGPSGCGKTTLLRCISGLNDADQGAITLTGKTVLDAERGIFLPPEKRGVGMVFQNYALWPHMTVAANVEFPLRARGQKSAIAGGRVREVLDIVQCGHLADRYPPQLSGGQQQRVALARALASRPDVMLLDEPLSNLDALLRIDLRAQLHQLHRQLGFTGIYVTHDQSEAMSLGTRVVVMRAGQVAQVGEPEAIFRRPANEYVAEFLGMRNRLPCTVTGEGKLHIGSAEVTLPPGTTRAGEYHLRTRPSALLLRSSADAASLKPEGALWVGGGRVVDRLPSGEVTEYIVDLGGITLLIEDRSDQALPKDSLVDVGILHRTLLFYEQSGELAKVK